MDKIKRLDETLKSRIAEQKAARSRVQFKSADDVQKEIDRLQKQVDTGTMKIVDEKKALAEVSQLNRQKKGFAGLDEADKGINDVKAQIAELKKSMDDPESKALSERYTEIQSELDQIKGEQDDVYKNLNALRDERTKAHEDQQKKYAAVKEIKDQYYQQRRAAADYEKEARRIRDEKRRAENDAYHRGRRQEAAKAKLEEASAPAYQDEIRTTQNLIAYFDPSSAQKQEDAVPGKYAAAASRSVDDSGIKGTRLAKKGDDDDSYFVGGGGKKNKRNKKQQGGTASPAPAAEGKFSLDLGTIDSLAKVGVDPPMSQNDVPTVIEKLKEKLEHWKGDQKKQTEEVSLAKALHSLFRLLTLSRILQKPSKRSIAWRLKQTQPTLRKTIVPVIRPVNLLKTTRASTAQYPPAQSASRRGMLMWMSRMRCRKRKSRTRLHRRGPRKTTRPCETLCYF